MILKQGLHVLSEVIDKKIYILLILKNHMLSQKCYQGKGQKAFPRVPICPLLEVNVERILHELA